MRFLLLIICFVLFGKLEAQLSGKLTDEKGEAIPYALIYEKTYEYTTVSNENGSFSLELPKGNYTVYFQILGYQTEERKITIGKEKITLTVTLRKASYTLPELTIMSNGEDPAYAIIRSAIKAKDVNKKAKQDYKANIYSKGLVKLLDAPEKILGQKIGSMGGILDSNKQGIVYLSESIVELTYLRPEQYYEKVTANKVSGDDETTPFASFANARVSLYNESTDFSRGIVSPIADAAMSFYEYRLLSSKTDETGYNIHRIALNPKSDNSPCYKGEIFIVDGTWHIQGVAVTILPKALKSPFLDTLVINQIYKPIQKNDWYIISQYIGFNAKVLGFKSGGNFNYIFLNHTFSDSPLPIKNKSEVFVVTKEAKEINDTFWNAIRPLELTSEEQRDFIKKDSLSNVWKSKPYLDSLDRRNNKFKIADLFFGYTGRNSFEKLSYGSGAILYATQFNPVEGWNLSLPFYYRKNTIEDELSFRFDSKIAYGFSDGRWKYAVKFSKLIDLFSLSSLNISGGRLNTHFNELVPISDYSNSSNSLIYKENFARYYDNTFAKIGFSREYTNGLFGTVNATWANRKGLLNTTNYSWFRTEETYEPNNIKNVSEYDLDSKMFSIDMSFRLRINQKYMNMGNYKNRIRSSWPDVFLSFNHALGMNEGYADFTKIKVRMEKTYIPMRTYGYGSLVIEHGRFLRAIRTTDVDVFHFMGNQISTAYISNYYNSFRLLEYYSMSSTKPYVTAFYQHRFEGFITDKIPLINRTKLRLVSNVATLLRQGEHHTEVGVGLEGFSIGIFNLFRLDYTWSWGQGSQVSSGFKIGLGEIFKTQTISY